MTYFAAHLRSEHEWSFPTLPPHDLLPARYGRGARPRGRGATDRSAAKPSDRDATRRGHAAADDDWASRRPATATTELCAFPAVRAWAEPTPRTRPEPACAPAAEAIAFDESLLEDAERWDGLS